MSKIDGKTVTWGHNESWRGKVISDSYIPGWVRIAWTHPAKVTDLAREQDLVVVDDSSQAP